MTMMAEAPWLHSGLPAEVDVIELEAGTRVFREGEADADFYIVLMGTIKLSRRSAAGRDVLIGLRGRGDHFGQVAAFDQAPRAVSAHALTSARVARIPQSALIPWLLRHPEMSLEILRSSARRVRRNNSALADMVGLKVAGRVAKQLLSLADELGRPGSGGTRVHHRLNQTELAQLAGTSRETCNKVLADFARAGSLRVEPGAVTIIDSGPLRSAATQPSVRA